MSSPFPGPIPPYNNLPPNPEFYLPRFFYITNVVLGSTTTITTAKDMNYVIGNLIRLIIPNGFGCSALSGHTGYVLSIPAPNQVVVGIYSNGVTPFVNPGFNTQPTIVPVGNINTGAINFGRNDNKTFIPGSFRNVSPF
jgi:hypothetical protein